MKIKTKKQLNLPQLIEWAMDNNVDNSIFIGKKNLYNVGFNKNGLMYFNTTKPIPTGEIFTVEVEKEITEDTVLPKVLFKNIFDDWRVLTEFCISEGKSVAEQVYLLNDDDTIGQLLWTKEKGFVE